MIHFQENDASRDVPTKNEEVIKTDKFSLQQKNQKSLEQKTLVKWAELQSIQNW